MLRPYNLGGLAIRDIYRFDFSIYYLHLNAQVPTLESNVLQYSPTVDHCLLVTYSYRLF